MPEYLAPGVYVEEVSFRSKSIEGVSTTTTGFVGPTRYGPADITPDVITSLVEYERTYGDRQPLQLGADTLPNYMWHAVRAFFENGGKRLYIARAYKPSSGDVLALDKPKLTDSPDAVPPGFAKGSIGQIRVYARFPGVAGNMQVRITLTAGANVLVPDNGKPALRGVYENDLVLLTEAATSPLSSPLADPFAIAVPYIKDGAQTWRFRRSGDSPAGARELSALDPATAQIRIVTATVTVFPADPSAPSLVYAGLALDPSHRRGGAPDSIQSQFDIDQPSLGRARSLPIAMLFGNLANADGVAVVKEILSLKTSILTSLLDPKSIDPDRSLPVSLNGGDDGKLPDVGDYEGIGGEPDSKEKSGLTAFEDIDDISIVAAPGSTANYNTNPSGVQAILGALIVHCTNMRYRIAVLDSGDKQTVADVRDMRAKLDSTYGALYYPWITIIDPLTGNELNVPPSGAVCGIYARNDINRGVYKAPANEVVETAINLEKILNKAQQDILNPLGVNCFRSFEGRGFRLWGARTISSDPEWKYVNLRRYFAYLEHSIDKGTQWAVFEPNGELLWGNLRRTIADFLLNEWQNGALLGDKPENAYFVKCDRSTMTQNDLDNGRLVCLVGVAALRPAEYVIIRIGQWTADRKV
ncbi:MAG TPA: phage tail sheath subtilisin-like domain-containing protein [Thermoanaerobaculia bacterium]|jgi:phage tail sheath protein FI|nr:phage tail sheath subtilisin-like domain-containing protein [Thermoanaerobaculia bacterium]